MQGEKNRPATLVFYLRSLLRYLRTLRTAMSNRLTLPNALELHRSRQLPRPSLYELRWRDGRTSGPFESADAAAESVHLVERAVVPGTFSFDGTWLRDCDGERVAEVAECES